MRERADGRWSLPGRLGRRRLVAGGHGRARGRRGVRLPGAGPAAAGPVGPVTPQPGPVPPLGLQGGGRLRPARRRGPAPASRPWTPAGSRPTPCPSCPPAAPPPPRSPGWSSWTTTRSCRRTWTRAPRAAGRPAGSRRRPRPGRPGRPGPARRSGTARAAAGGGGGSAGRPRPAGGPGGGPGVGDLHDPRAGAAAVADDHHPDHARVGVAEERVGAGLLQAHGGAVPDQAVPGPLPARPRQRVVDRVAVDDRHLAARRHPEHGRAEAQLGQGQGVAAALGGRPVAAATPAEAGAAARTVAARTARSGTRTVSRRRRMAGSSCEVDAPGTPQRRARFPPVLQDGAQDPGSPLRGTTSSGRAERRRRREETPPSRTRRRGP